ncbi:hypothetical protein FPQ18DRAFT_345060 [Pyronema domesticum]|nr:hypothetical protein FPQ18DRAFT_345060 [Pyronema domesticum]
MHPAQLGVDVYGPPVHTGPEDPDFDVKPAPCGTEFPTQKACLDLCKLPTDGSVKWNELEPADVLRAVRRFRLRFPRVCWEQAEDYIFEKFGKIGSEGTRGGKIRENRKADAKGLPAPHKIRQWNMAKKSKAASAPAGDAMNLESVVSVDAEATTSVDQGNYFATGALAPTADGNLFFGSDMDLDDDEEVVADDHDVRIQAAIEEMQADRADVPPPPTPTVAPEGYDSATPTSDYSAFLHFFAQNQAHYRNDVDAALVAFATRYEVNVSMPAIPAIFDAPAAPVALGVISTTGTQFISNLEAPAVAFANREHAAGAASGVPKAWSDNDEANLERFPGSEPKDL